MAYNPVYGVHDFACDYVSKDKTVSQENKATLVDFLNLLAIRKKAKLEMAISDIDEKCHITSEDFIPVRTRKFYQEMLAIENEVIANNNNMNNDKFLKGFIIQYMDFEDKSEVLKNL